MNFEKADLIRYRIERAFETLEEAKILANANHWNTVANRLYYSCFYAINSLFVFDKINAHTHNGVKSNFHKEYIKNGKFDIKYGKMYNQLFNKRGEGDYEDFVKFKKEVIEPYIMNVEDFLMSVNNYIT